MGAAKTDEMTPDELEIWSHIYPHDMCFGLRGEPMCENRHNNAFCCYECWGKLDSLERIHDYLDLLHPLARHNRFIRCPESWH